MIRRQNIVLLGSTGRNSGKTLFACDLIRKYSDLQNVVGVKVTTIDKISDGCPRGGAGCGVCASLKGTCEIIEETNTAGNKDTERMLAAGAKKVFWLRVLRSNLDEGLNHLLKNMDDNSCVVCESNSIRSVLEPGLLLIFQSKTETEIKDTCRQIIDSADRIVVFDGKSFNLSVDEIVFDEGWRLTETASAIVLAGGKSKRMGQNKSLLPVNGTTLLENTISQLKHNFREIIISTDKDNMFRCKGLKTVSDSAPGQGPLMGIMSGLKASENDLNFVIACDIPDININLVRRLLRSAEGYDAVVPVTPDDELEPLFAVYRKQVISKINNVLKSGKRKIRELYKTINVNYIKLDNLDWYTNLNTKEDYENYVKKL